MTDDIPAVSFLLRCKEKAKHGPEELAKFIETKETGPYYLRYGFIKRDCSGLSDYGLKVIEFAPTEENLIPLLAKIFELESECHGSWILLQRIYYNPQAPIYQFEASSTADSTFIYAVFLSEFGIFAQDITSWAQSEPHDYYRIPFSSLGKRLIERVRNRNFTVVPEVENSEPIAEQSQPTNMVYAHFEINAPNLRQIHLGDGDNLQDSTKYQDVEEVNNE